MSEAIKPRGRVRPLKDSERLRNALAPYVVDVAFLCFDKAAGQQRSLPQREHVIENQQLLKDVIAVSPRLAATKKCIETALMSIISAKENKLPIAVVERTSWVTTMAQRLQKLFRRTQQLRISKNPPAWFSELHFAIETGDRPDEGTEADSCAAADVDGGIDGFPIEEGQEEELQSNPDEVVDPDTTEPIQKWAHHFDKCSFRPYRLPCDNCDAAPDYGDLKVPEGAKTADAMLAVWPDGSSWQIPQLTVGMHAAGSKTKGHQEEWIAQDGQAVKVSWRWNAPKGKRKQKLCRITHGGRQVIHMDTIYFDMNEEATMAWCVDIAKKFANGTLAKDGCMAQKALREKENIAVPVLKRPALACAGAAPEPPAAQTSPARPAAAAASSTTALATIASPCASPTSVASPSMLSGESLAALAWQPIQAPPADSWLQATPEFAWCAHADNE